MRAMLLTAGFGERMFPLTLSQPKPCIPVLGRPLVVQILHWLARRGVSDAVLNLHHLPDSIRRAVSEGAAPGLPTVSYSLEDELLGTAGGLRHAGDLLRGETPIVICNSDFLSNVNLEAAIESHLRSGMAATLVLAPKRDGYSIVCRDEEGRVISLAGRPEVDRSRVTGEHLFTGCHIIDEEVLDLIPSNGPSDIVRDVYIPLAAEGRLGSFLHDGFWWEFGSPELYLDGCLGLLARPAAELGEISVEHDTIRRIGDADVAVGPGAEFQNGTRFVGCAALGFSAHVTDGAHIEDSVVMPEAWIGPGCRLKHAVIGAGVELPAGMECESELVCIDSDPGMSLPRSTRRRGGMLVYSFSKSGTR